MTRPILILGAGIYQVPLITKAKKFGLRTIVVSRAGEYPGIRLADKFYEIDTTDIQSCLRIAKNENIATVLTAGSDVCVPTMAEINAHLSLRGVTPRIANIMSNKHHFRKFQSEHNITHPTFFIHVTYEDTYKRLIDENKAFMVKPADSSGSRGISQVYKPSLAALKNYISSASNASRTNTVCVEEFIKGTEISGNALLYNGDILFFGLTTKHNHQFRTEGHSYPTQIPLSDQHAVQREILKCCRLLQYTDGPLNFDVMLAHGMVYIIEMGARLGGNGMTSASNYSYDYDAEMELLRIVLNIAPKNYQDSEIIPHGSLVFGSPISGYLKHIQGFNEVRKYCPWLLELNLQRRIGEYVPAIRNDADLIGCAVFRIPSDESWSSCKETLIKHLNIGVAE